MPQNAIEVLSRSFLTILSDSANRPEISPNRDKPTSHRTRRLLAPHGRLRANVLFFVAFSSAIVLVTRGLRMYLMTAKSDLLLSTSDAGKLLNLTPDAVRRLTRLGQLVPDQQTPSGYQLFWQSSIERFAEVRRELLRSKDRRPGRPPRQPFKKGRSKTHQ